MDPLLNILSQLGLGMASNAVYDYLRRKLTSKGAPIDRSALEAEIQNIITPSGVTMRAATVVEALAHNGFLVIDGSHLHGPEGLTFGSIQGSAIAGNNTRLSTNKTSIDAGAGAFVKTQG